LNKVDEFLELIKLSS